MRGLNWRAVTPILLLGAFLVSFGAVMLPRASSAVRPFFFQVLAGLVVLLSLMALAAWLRRRKSRRTWCLMVQADPDSTHFITFVYPTVKDQLVRLGWRLHGPAYLSVPAIGVGIGDTGVTFWEAGVEGPTLTLTASNFTAATVATVSDGYRSHPAIELTLRTANRSNRLQLNLRDFHHHNLSAADLQEAGKRIRVQSRPGEPS